MYPSKLSLYCLEFAPPPPTHYLTHTSPLSTQNHSKKVASWKIENFPKNITECWILPQKPQKVFFFKKNKKFLLESKKTNLWLDKKGNIFVTPSPYGYNWIEFFFNFKKRLLGSNLFHRNLTQTQILRNPISSPKVCSASVFFLG